jgi:hypothetical protein
VLGWLGGIAKARGDYGGVDFWDCVYATNTLILTLLLILIPLMMPLLVLLQLILKPILIPSQLILTPIRIPPWLLLTYLLIPLFHPNPQALYKSPKQWKISGAARAMKVDGLRS